MACNPPVIPKWYHFIIIFPFFALIRLWQASIRFVHSQNSENIIASPKRMIGVAWHDSIFSLPIAKWRFRKNFPMAGLVSASKDGSYLCAYFRFCGIGAVRGSSRNRASASALGLIDALRSGSDIFITPDGPLGPMHRAKSGFIKIADATNVRILLIHISPRRYLKLNTWDSFKLPLPFSKVDIKAFEFSDSSALIAAANAAGVEPQDFVARFLSNGNFDI